MSKLLAGLKERDQELEVFVKFIVLIDNKAAVLSVPNRLTWKTREIDDRVVKILKANFFLILYNVIEASVRDGLRCFYEAVGAEVWTARTLRKELRKLWIESAMHQLKPDTASRESYRKLTMRLVATAVEDVAITLNADDLRFGGNLDAARIRKVCADHGIPYATRPEAKGGEKLMLVKDRRNGLAHGHISFVECGRDYSVEQLMDIKRETLIYVRGILRNIDNHASRRKYRSAVP